MSLIRSLIRNSIYPYVLRRENRGSTYTYWDFYKKSQYWPKEQLLEFQFQKLKELLKYSYENCVYYKESFDSAGITPDSIKNLEDISLLPILTRDLLFERNDDLISSKFPKSELQEFYTGGTTGQQAKMYRDQESFNMKLALEWRNESWMGKKLCERTMYFWPAHIDFNENESFKEKIKNKYILGHKVVNAGFSGQAIFDGFYREMLKFKPRFVKVFPASFLGFVEYLDNNNIPAPKIEAIMSTGEVLYEDQRHKFEKVFNCPVFDMYGSRETGNNSCECSAHEGLHLSLETALVEFVDENNKSVEYGQEGEMLITDLTNYGMPIIRYQINDFGVPLKEICSCGRELPMMSSAVGRLHDFIYTPDGIRHNGNVLGIHTTVAEEGIEIGQLQYIQKSLIHFHVRLKNNPPPTERMHEYLTRQIKKIVDERIEVTFETVEEIPKEKSGKTRYVICEIDPKTVNNITGN